MSKVFVHQVSKFIDTIRRPWKSHLVLFGKRFQHENAITSSISPTADALKRHFGAEDSTMSDALNSDIPSTTSRTITQQRTSTEHEMVVETPLMENAVLDPRSDTSIGPLKDSEALTCALTPLNVLKAEVQAGIQDEAALQRSRRMQILYDITHPRPQDYTYNGRLVPPPPVSFGVLTEESAQIAHKMIVEPQYQLVHQSTMFDYHFEINDLYLEIAFTGRANSGKSSLLNALLSQPRACKSSTTPGSTRHISYYQSVDSASLQNFQMRHPNRLVKLPGGGLQFTFVDLPGWGLQGMKPTWSEHALQCNQNYLGTRRSLNTVIFCKDASVEWNSTDEKYFTMINNSHGRCFVVLTKCDTVGHSLLCKRIHDFYVMITAKKNSYRAYPLIIPTSSRGWDPERHHGIDFLRRLIVETSGMIQGKRMRWLAYSERASRAKSGIQNSNASPLSVTDPDRRVQKEPFFIKSGSDLMKSSSHLSLNSDEECVLACKTVPHKDRNIGNDLSCKAFVEDSSRKSDVLTSDLVVPNCHNHSDEQMKNLDLFREARMGTRDDHSGSREIASPEKNCSVKMTIDTPYGKVRAGFGGSNNSSKDITSSTSDLQDPSAHVPFPSPLPKNASEEKDGSVRKKPKKVERREVLMQSMNKLVRSEVQAKRHGSGAIAEGDLDGSIRGYYLAGTDVKTLGWRDVKTINACYRQGIEKKEIDAVLKQHSPDRKVKLREMTQKQQQAYAKFSGTTLQGKQWDQYVSVHRSHGYCPVTKRKLSRSESLALNKKYGSDPDPHVDGRLRRYAHPPGLFRDYGKTHEASTFSNVIGV